MEKDLEVVDKRRSYDDAPAKPFTAVPLGDYIVVKRIPEPQGLIVEADIAQDKPIQCEVVAISPTTRALPPKTWFANGDQWGPIMSEPVLKVGDKVLIRRYSGTEVKVEGIEYTLILVQDVLLRL